MSTTATKIKGLIRESGLTQAKFAESVGLHPVTLSRFLTSDNFSPKALQKIATITGTTLADLLPDDDAVISPVVTGYLEYNGEIEKIRDLKSLKRFTDKVERQVVLMKTRPAKLPRQSPISLDDIDLDKWENYDASKVEIMSFRHHYDIVRGMIFNIGNMCSGYPFTVNGFNFCNSEAAYIAGLYSHDIPEHRRIQKLLMANEDGYRAKKEFRNKRYEDIARKDWDTFYIEWMKYVVWEKCQTNKDFASLLKKIPDTAMIVENSTGMTSPRAQLWGCFNNSLEELRDAKGLIFKTKHPKATDTEINEERNRWCNFGIWTGRNVMGKIIKMCSLCLQSGQELPIDYSLLKSKHIYICGIEVEYQH